MTKVQRGQCDGCGHRGLPIVDGLMQLHTNPSPFARGTCSGSGKPPRRSDAGLPADGEERK